MCRYMERWSFADIAKVVEARMKKKHTVIKPWPWKLKKVPGTREALEEYNILRATSCTGLERYVEWRWV